MRLKHYYGVVFGWKSSNKQRIVRRWIIVDQLLGIVLLHIPLLFIGLIHANSEELLGIDRLTSLARAHGALSLEIEDHSEHNLHIQPNL